MTAFRTPDNHNIRTAQLYTSEAVRYNLDHNDPLGYLAAIMLTASEISVTKGTSTERLLHIALCEADRELDGLLSDMLAEGMINSGSSANR